MASSTGSLSYLRDLDYPRIDDSLINITELDRIMADAAYITNTNNNGNAWNLSWSQERLNELLNTPIPATISPYSIPNTLDYFKHINYMDHWAKDAYKSLGIPSDLYWGEKKLKSSIKENIICEVASHI